MKLIYEATGVEVKIGDTPAITRAGVVLQGIVGTVVRIEEPDRPMKPGKVFIKIAPIPSGDPVEELAEIPRDMREFFSVDKYLPTEIGAVWR